jgi:hypothetical protein
MEQRVTIYKFHKVLALPRIFTNRLTGGKSSAFIESWSGIFGRVVDRKLRNSLCQFRSLTPAHSWPRLPAARDEQEMGVRVP